MIAVGLAYLCNLNPKHWSLLDPSIQGLLRARSSPYLSRAYIARCITLLNACIYLATKVGMPVDVSRWKDVSEDLLGISESWIFASDTGKLKTVQNMNPRNGGADLRLSLIDFELGCEFVKLAETLLQGPSLAQPKKPILPLSTASNTVARWVSLSIDLVSPITLNALAIVLEFAKDYDVELVGINEWFSLALNAACDVSRWSSVDFENARYKALTAVISNEVCKLVHTHSRFTTPSKSFSSLRLPQI